MTEDATPCPRLLLKGEQLVFLFTVREEVTGVGTNIFPVIFPKGKLSGFRFLSLKGKKISQSLTVQHLFKHMFK
jgi:hypothetical protein